MWELLFLAVAAAAAWVTFYYIRKSANSAPKAEPQIPIIDVKGGAIDGHPKWYKLHLVARNIEPVKWRVVAAEMKSPKTGKLATEADMPDVVQNDPWDPPAKDVGSVDPDRLTRGVEMNMVMAPKGTNSCVLIRGTNDHDIADLWAYLPGQETHFSIRFNLRSSAETAMYKYLMLSMNITAKNKIVID